MGLWAALPLYLRVSFHGILEKKKKAFLLFSHSSGPANRKGGAEDRVCSSLHGGGLWQSAFLPCADGRTSALGLGNEVCSGLLRQRTLSFQPGLGSWEEGKEGIQN